MSFKILYKNIVHIIHKMGEILKIYKINFEICNSSFKRSNILLNPQNPNLSYFKFTIVYKLSSSLCRDSYSSTFCMLFSFFSCKKTVFYYIFYLFMKSLLKGTCQLLSVNLSSSLQNVQKILTLLQLACNLIC